MQHDLAIGLDAAGFEGAQMPGGYFGVEGER
jgi:hypothetical protein